MNADTDLAGPGQKCVLVLATGLPLGLAANTAGVLAMSLGRAAPHLIGPVVTDASGQPYPGLTVVPLPVLNAAPDALRGLASRARDGDLLAAAVTDAAQESKTYPEYEGRLAVTPGSRLHFLGIALWGPARTVNKLTGSLPLLR